MANFEEGRVYFTQTLGTGHHQLDDEEEEAGVAIERDLKEFIACAGDYRQQLARDATLLEIDLDRFDGRMKEQIVNNPTEYLPLLERAASARAAEFQQLSQQGDLPEVQVALKCSKKEPRMSMSMRAIGADRISKLVHIPGIIIAASKPKSKATYVTIQCKDCKAQQRLAVKPGMGGVILPRRCTLSDNNPGAERCSMDPFVVMSNQSKFVDQQTLKLQERPEDVPTGEMPRNVILIVDRHLVDRVTPGMRVNAVGIFSIYQAHGAKAKQDSLGSLTVRQPYIRVVGISEDEHMSLHGNISIADEERIQFMQFAALPDVHEKIFAMVAPEIFGHKSIKEAIACLLFGGTRKKMVDNTFRRGDINVLLLGDPSTAKSQFLKFASKAAPIAVYTSGKGSSAAGLTAAVVRDPQTREFYLEGGAMVLADNGIVCIDEFDKMRVEDRVAIHEAMEQQTISIAKAGITTMLKARTSVLAAANPPSGRYDDLKTAQENIDLQSTILSRFDLIFIVKDTRNVEKDRQIARHVLDVHRMASMQINDDRETPLFSPSVSKRQGADTPQNIDFLKRYAHYAKRHCTPQMSEEASRVLEAEYVSLRTEARRIADSGHGLAVPITMRQLEAIIRISESLARMQLSAVVDVRHVQKALAVFKASTMDAAKSGMMDGYVFTEQQRLELRAVENQIREKIPRHAYMSERRLLDMMHRIGVDAMIVQRAILSLVQQSELDYMSHRKVLRRRN
ncbi:unnamed protein product [Ostreobium quekettii]|uniref:DNA replication licensing factor MCM5 n=1 Tax=Ostreobium quekettii TaxID=121088 RepID=A0A8S1IX47_9CHLO|nr:unnamed protein product [Ostreobium quekettii]|eukprot:evm.model.scf_1080.6 EVM.evm.TU.scf_1080.6   scf_1080:39232-49748(+)